MAKFQPKSAQEPAPMPVPASPVAVTPPVPTAHTPPPTSTPDVILIQKDHPVGGGDLANILTDDPTNKDKDVPNTKHADEDFSRNELFMHGKRVIQTDALSRALNADCYLLDVPKPWGVNPLGARPVSVYYTREFPGKGILYDNFDASPELNTKEKMDKAVEFKMTMANAHGFIYLYQHPWTTLTTSELDRQLALQKEIIKAMQKK